MLKILFQPNAFRCSSSPPSRDRNKRLDANKVTCSLGASPSTAALTDPARNAAERALFPTFRSLFITRSAQTTTSHCEVRLKARKKRAVCGNLIIVLGKKKIIRNGACEQGRSENTALGIFWHFAPNTMPEEKRFFFFVFSRKIQKHFKQVGVFFFIAGVFFPPPWCVHLPSPDNCCSEPTYTMHCGWQGRHTTINHPSIHPYHPSLPPIPPHTQQGGAVQCTALRSALGAQISSTEALITERLEFVLP